MKKTITIFAILCIGLVIFLSGCNEQENGGTTTGNTVTMTAEELNDDMNIETDWTTYMKILYDSLENGDTLIIEDTIDNISYEPIIDRTVIIFDISEGEGMTSSLNYPFEGDISDIYQIGDQVKITATIKHVEFTFEEDGASMDYELEIFDEMWTTQEEYIASGGGTLPSSCITKL